MDKGEGVEDTEPPGTDVVDEAPIDEVGTTVAGVPV